MPSLIDSVTVSFLLPPPPSAWESDKSFKVHKRIAPTKHGRIEPVGSEFLGVVRRNRYNRTLTQDWELEAALLDADSGEIDMTEDEPETAKLLASNPDEWKKQDHYAILGLSRLRWRATDDDIKQAYRRKVLKHHPDKKASKSGHTNDDAFFKCIQKAFEVISDATKRRQWDSVDPTFDDAIPTHKFTGDFYTTFAKAFEKEARFSKNKDVFSAPFGDEDSPREVVERFYGLWLKFESWRTFEMLDEEEEGMDGSRDAKRWLDKKNKAARSKLKTEDNARITRLVELAMKLDPRIIRLKEQERYAKDAKKRERDAAAKKLEEEAKLAAEQEILRAENEAKEAKERREAEKKEKEAHKKVVKKSKKELKALFSGNNSFLPQSATATESLKHQEMFDSILESAELFHLEEFKERLDLALPSGVKSLAAVLEEEFTAASSRKAAVNSSSTRTGSVASSSVPKKAKPAWTPKEVTTLIKAIKAFPGGSISRWEKISEYVNLHGISEGEAHNDRTADECIKKSKEMQEATASERAALQTAASEAAKKKETIIKDDPTSRDKVNTDLKVAPVKKEEVGSRPVTSEGGFIIPEGDKSWTPAQQSALEEALRKFPPSMFISAPAERWEKIANEIPGKNKKEVKQRMKDLSDAIKKKGKK